ncbi:MAG: DUF3152 domain-containing protein [Micromonosporaceae bacterium]|nr:DUF3152 domain-containing protein [Micromonosporaceae bacterium]
MAGTDLDSEAHAAEQPAIPDAVLSPDASVRQTGPGTFTYGAGGGTPVGAAGTLRRYQVAVEDNIGQDVAAFGEIVDAILGDQRSWIAGKDVRLQRVGKDAAADFTIFLATPTTSERMCAAVGLRTKKYTSCRAGHKVIINLARWLTAVPNYGASVATYRQYVVNHEVGHELGHGHEACPGRGKKAPTMQQQTFGLDGCVPNPWPYLGGKRYTGPSAA